MKVSTAIVSSAGFALGAFAGVYMVACVIVVPWSKECEPAGLLKGRQILLCETVQLDMSATDKVVFLYEWSKK